MPWIERDITAYEIIERGWSSDAPRCQEPDEVLWLKGGYPCDCGGYAMYFGDFAACMKCLKTYELMPRPDGKAE